MKTSAPDRRRLFRRHAALAVVTGALTVLTFLAPAWLEVLGVDPDHGNGSAERLVLAVVAVAFLASLVLAGAAWRRLRTT